MKKKGAPKLGHGTDLQMAPKHPFPTHTFNPYTWGYGPGTKPSYPFVSVNTSQSLCFGFPPPGAAKDNVAQDNALLKGGMTPLPAPWLGRSALPFSNLDAFWDKAFGLPRPISSGGSAGGFRAGMYPPSVAKPPCGGGGGGEGGRRGEHLGDGLNDEGRMGDEEAERKRERRESSSLDMSRDSHPSHPAGSGMHTDRLSAFRPVGRNNTQAVEDDRASAGSDATAGELDETEEIDVMEEDFSSPQDLSRPELRETQTNNDDSAGRIEEKEGEEEEEGGERGEKEGSAGKDVDGDEPPEKRQRPSQDDVMTESEHDVIDYADEVSHPMVEI